MRNIIMEIQEAFILCLQEKNSWGKNEVEKLYLKVSTQILSTKAADLEQLQRSVDKIQHFGERYGITTFKSGVNLDSGKIEFNDLSKKLFITCKAWNHKLLKGHMVIQYPDGGFTIYNGISELNIKDIITIDWKEWDDNFRDIQIVGRNFRGTVPSSLHGFTEGTDII